MQRENVELRAAISFLMADGGVSRLFLPVTGERSTLCKYLPVDWNSPKPTFCTLPAEIVRIIFEEAIPAAYQYNPSMPASPSNSWPSVLATKMALPLICRTHYWEGMSVLYNDISLRRLSQIFALARTLRSTQGAHIRPLVKIIRMDSCPVGGDFVSRAREDLWFMLQECRAVRSLSYHPHPNFPILSDESPSSSGGSDFDPLWCFHATTSHTRPPVLDGLVSSRLRRLNLKFALSELQLQNLHGLLLGTTSLQSLVLDYAAQAILSEGAAKDMSAVRLHSLVELCIPFGQDQVFDEYICATWELPKLTHLTLISVQSWPERPLECFGGHLVYLNVFAKHYLDVLSCNADPCPTLASHCPMIEHLVLPNPHGCSYPFPVTSVTSPTLKHLDIWDFGTYQRLITRKLYYCWQEPRTSIRWMKNVQSEGSVPALQTFRFLFTEYGQYCGLEWPLICHPTLLLDRPNDEIFHTFPNAFVTQTATRLIAHSPHPLPNAVDDDSTSESDSDDSWMPSRRRNGADGGRGSSSDSSGDGDSEATGTTEEVRDVEGFRL